MCAIVGSFDKDKLIELIELNSYRGSHSYSISIYSRDMLFSVKKEIGKINYNDIFLIEGQYGIVHIQAPTTEAKDEVNIHPARFRLSDRYYKWPALWHNGIIKSSHVKKMQVKYGIDTDWDTELLLRAYIEEGARGLSEIDGSFSCLYYDRACLFLFRNDISPMFYDKDLNISSTMFKESISTPANRILKLDLQSRALYNIGEFKTVENPYFFADE